MTQATTVLGQQIRSGSDLSASVAVPATDPGTGLPITTVAVSGTMSDADAQNPANACVLTLMATFDGGQTWQNRPPYAWQGGVGPKGNFTTPAFSTAVPTGDAGQLPDGVRVLLDTRGNNLNTGLTVAFSS